MPGAKPIGGFFELETQDAHANFHTHANGFSNGRTCLKIVLQETGAKNVYVPFYSCDTLLSPFSVANADYTFYSINDKFEPSVLPDLKEDELFLYINYFGLKSSFARHLLHRYGRQLIIDNTHAYFEKTYSPGWSFNSARKYFGVPDGAYLYSSTKVNMTFEKNRNFITDHLVLRLDGRQAEAFQYFRQNEDRQNCELYSISLFSEKILDSIDYEFVGKRRRENFNIYQSFLHNENRVTALTLSDDAVPFCYPYMGRPIDLSYFYKNHIFIPSLWKDVIDRESPDFSLEKQISAAILPLPVDHRYGKEDIINIIELINAYK